MAIVHELSWSASRAGNFGTCKRRYYHDYYGSWLGWDRSAEEARKRTYLLKKMTRMPMLAGTVLHASLAEWFDRRAEGREMTESEVADFALGALRQGYKESRDGAWRARPSKLTHLAEHHYGEACIDESTDAARDYGSRFVERIKAGTATFFRAPELAEARAATPQDYLTVEGRAAGDRQARGLDTIELFGEKVYAIPDFALRSVEDGEPRYVVFDWKSGRPSERDEFQLGVYVLYAMQKWGARPEDVVCVDAYLTRGEFVTKRFDEPALAEISNRIERSLGEMRAVHFDADRSLGEPEAFPMIEDSGSRECASCNYRELCER
jgi:CRISPR/Cas system-associated exonuclease Cas4 (RecB family)